MVVQPTPNESPMVVPFLLSLNAGYVDTAGFLALQGLFTAHVTGNFVTFGAAVALGTTGAVAKLLAPGVLSRRHRHEVFSVSAGRCWAAGASCYAGPAAG